MTKSEWEDLIDTSVSNDNLYENIIKRYAVIKRGVSPHPYADVLHQWIEGVEIQVKLDGEWSDYLVNREYINAFEYRLKPKEPVYEWQWYAIVDGTAIFYNHESKHFFTDEEASYFTLPLHRIEETKRIRKEK